MKIENTRFGTIEFDEARAIEMPAGLIGFPKETRFILLEPPTGRVIAWLQSLVSPELAFPVLGAIAFGEDYPSPDVRELGRRAHLERSPDDEFTALVVVASPRGKGRIANLLAPIIVNIGARVAAQVVLDADVYSYAEPLEVGRLSLPSPPLPHQASQAAPLYANGG